MVKQLHEYLIRFLSIWRDSAECVLRIKPTNAVCAPSYVKLTDSAVSGMKGVSCESRLRHCVADVTYFFE